MREILFRGKSKHNDEWVNGFYSPLIWYPSLEQTPSIKTFKGGDMEINPETVGQYTGLTDKNGTEIFEGDIVRINGWWYASGPAGYKKNMTVVKYDNEVCGFTPMCNYDTDCGVFHSAEECEVIGNVFDNPELLEKVEE